MALDKVEATGIRVRHWAWCMAAGGYPDDYRKGDRIDGLDGADAADLKVFHAGTREQNGQVLTMAAGYSVSRLWVTRGRRAGARLSGAGGIHWTDCQYRRDIGYRAVAREMPPLTTASQGLDLPPLSLP
jgi:phosphoribosylamine---glycine ligase